MYYGIFLNCTKAVMPIEEFQLYILFMFFLVILQGCVSKAVMLPLKKKLRERHNLFLADKNNMVTQESANEAFLNPEFDFINALKYYAIVVNMAFSIGTLFPLAILFGVLACFCLIVGDKSVMRRSCIPNNNGY
mmetsp:Transcript_35702/g.32175  ORF Transcript_35702/g.32175 Transcript_35702/m.32175 type:complete len:134 (+) Transcript_35702:303-704(+)